MEQKIHWFEYVMHAWSSWALMCLIWHYHNPGYVVAGIMILFAGKYLFDDLFQGLFVKSTLIGVILGLLTGAFV